MRKIFVLKNDRWQKTDSDMKNQQQLERNSSKHQVFLKKFE
jgi:hypothetical protein